MNKIFNPYRLWLAAFAVAALFTGCSDEDERYAPGVPATFIPTIEGADTDPATRASNNLWALNDKIGVFMVKNGTISSMGTASNRLATNIQYQTTAAGESVSLTPVSSPIYYPMGDDKVNFVAYYPYTATLPTATTYAVNVGTVAAYADLAKVDLLYHSSTDAYSRYNAAASLTFKHKLSKVVINVTRGAGVTSDLKAGMVTKITGTPTKAAFDLTKGTLGSLNTTTLMNVAPQQTATSAATKYVAEAILVPHAAGTTYTNRAMTFTINDITYTYAIPTTVTFEEGKVYTYNLILSAAGVVLKETTISNWGEGTAAWGGNYVLDTSETSLAFTAQAYTQTLTVRTKGTTTKPVVKYSTSATTVTGTPACIEVPTLSDGTVSGEWTNYTLTVKSIENTGTGLRAGYVHVSVEGLTQVITVGQIAGSVPKVTTDIANCYMIVPSQSLTFPVSRAFDGGVLDASYTGTFTVQKLWDDNDVLTSIKVEGSGASAQITVHASMKEGNALVALKNSSGTIVWSYHIWVTEYVPNGTTFDRLLGARANVPHTESHDVRACGLFYQYGRKDPIPRQISRSTGAAGMPAWWVPSERTSALEYITTNTIQHPDKFFNTRTAAYTGHTWLGGKTINDPCPAGYRVGIGSFNNYVDMGLSRYLPTDNLYWPRCGCYRSGGLAEPGYAKLQQNQSYSHTYLSYYAYWNGSNSSTGSYVQINEALQVRCVAESSTVTTTTDVENSYMVTPGNGITFPVTRAYEGGVLSEGYTGTWTVAKLWDDNSVIKSAEIIGTGANAWIKVVTNRRDGNALIGLKSSGGTIVWSYHIWATDYKPTTTWMDRDLGATTNRIPRTAEDVTSCGLLYQYGRKDPFPGSTSFTTPTEPTYFTLSVSTLTSEETIKAPMTFAQDWSGPEGILARTSDKIKHIGDPCPKGYKIPSDENLSTLAGYDGGRAADYTRSFGEIGFFVLQWQRLNSKNGQLADKSTSRQTYYYRPATGKNWTIYQETYANKMYGSNTLDSRPTASPIRCIKI